MLDKKASCYLIVAACFLFITYKILVASLISILYFSSLPVFAASKIVQTSEKSATAYIYSPLGKVGEEHVVSVDGGDGEWRYGCKSSMFSNGYIIYSNFYHKTKTHKSSVKVDSRSNDSGWVSAGETSRASLSADREDTGYCKYECLE